MKRELPSKIGIGALLAAAFILGLAWAFPWDSVVECSLAGIAGKGTLPGVQVGYSWIRTISRFPPRVEIGDLAAGNMLGTVLSPRAVLEVRPLDSLLRMAPSFAFESPAATIRMTGTEPLAVKTLKARGALERPGMSLDEASAGGDLPFSGKGKWSAQERRFTKADFLVTAPTRLAEGMALLAASAGLKPEGDRRWRLLVP